MILNISYKSSPRKHSCFHLQTLQCLLSICSTLSKEVMKGFSSELKLLSREASKHLSPETEGTTNDAYFVSFMTLLRIIMKLLL